jgi:hypothetical protein
MIYIICPANHSTGGTEVLHQLGYKLKLLHWNVRICYLNTEDSKSPVCDEFLKYNVPYCEKIDDRPHNVVIIPEIYISVLQQIDYCKKVIWWLSVDNAQYSMADENIFKKDTSILHLAQSQYAMEFLQKEMGIESHRLYYLSDYINSDFLLSSLGNNQKARENVVLFNPSKGISETAHLIAVSDAAVSWRALRGLSSEQMCSVLQQSKVYIDFGNHPGKDRIPREAALCGCCVLTNKKGSAANSVDVPIPEKYKFQEETPSEIYSAIKEFVANYESEKENYRDYVYAIQNEFVQFEVDIVKCFEQITSRQIPTYDTERDFMFHIREAMKNEDYLKAYRLLVKYRVSGWEENVALAVLETGIRLGIGEIAEAKVTALRGLQQDPDNRDLRSLLEQIDEIK